MTTLRPSTSIYNPGLLHKDELIATFAARRPLLDTLVDDVRRGGKQHHLVIGQRGAGKTTLLLRLAYAIEDDADLAWQAVALRFPEEQYNVAHLSDFWLNCVDALIDVLERVDVAAARKLDAEVDRIEDLDEDERARAGLELLTGWARQSKRVLILLVDNVDLVLERLSGQHWALREVLSAHNRLMLVGASSTFIQESFSYGEAFYDFFHVHELAPLAEDEARAMLEHLADATGAAHVRDVLAEPGRFAALHLMSGGMPRTLVLLHRILASQTSARAEEDFEALLDQVTPYYKARFDELPAQTQLVVHALAMHWHPMTAIECAESARLDVNSVSSQLNRLVRQGLVSKLATPDSAKLSFLITERFFAIWYSMRASRRLRRRLLWLVEAVQALYGQREVERRAQELLAAGEGASAAADPARLLAYASKVEDTALRARLELVAIQKLLPRGQVVPAVGESLDLEGEDRHLAPLVERVQTLLRVRRDIEAAPVRWSEPFTPAQLAEAVCGHVTMALAQKVQFATWIESGWELAVAMLGFTVIPGTGGWYAEAVARGDVASLRDVASPRELEALLAVIDRRALLHLLSEAIVYLPEWAEPVVADHARRLPAPSLANVAFLVLWFASHGRDVGRALQAALRIQTSDSIKHLAVPGAWRPLALRGYAKGLASMLAELGWREQLLPLYEGLRAIGDGQHDALLHLAPEARGPAAQVVAELLDAGADFATAFRPYRVPTDTASRAAETKPGAAVRRPRGKKGAAAKR